MKFLNQTNSPWSKPPGLKSLLVALIACALAMGWWFENTAPAPCLSAGDCARYTAMSEGFKSGHYQAIEHPFNARILTPWVVSILPTSTIDGFSLVSYASFLVFVVAWYLISRKLDFPTHVFGFLVVWFLIHPLGIPLYYEMRELVDPMGYALMGTALYFYLSRRHALFFITTLVALFEKESFLFVLAVATITELHMARRGHQSTADTARFVACALATILIYKILIHVGQQAFFPPEGKGNIFRTILYWWHRLRHDPARLVVWLGAFSCVTGTMVALLFSPSPPQSSRDDVQHGFFLKLGALGFVVLGLLGGYDMSRIMFNGMVFIFPAIFLRARALTRQPQIFIVYITALMIALTYPLFFRTTFEYSYYDSRDVTSSALFVLGVGLSLMLVHKALRAHRKAIVS